ncbi:MAG TPA: SlyX family protein [Polyangiaceae bacterium]|nr:SlyX family protein [Polyangiaceae bacterium]
MPAEDAARLLILEEKVAYQDKTILELNEVVTDLNRQLADLKSRLEQIERLLGAELSRREMPNEKPPHY